MIFKIGDRVSLKESALSLSYIIGRSTYTNMYEGKKGKIIGFTQNGDKLAIEFDDIVFTNYLEHQSSHDNGCHGKGKLHYCWYIPHNCIELIKQEIKLETNLIYWL